MSSESASAGQGALNRFFKPRSIALVGATEKSLWSNMAYDNLQRFGFAGPVHLINPKGGIIYKRQAAASCTAVGEPIDAALLMVPEAALADAIADLGRAGISGAVVLSSGFAELGASGAQRQQRITEAARAAGVRLLGPNCLGYVNFTSASPLWTTQLRRPMEDRSVAVVSQSGATAGQLAQFAYQQRVGFTHMISTGNEADIDIADAIEFLIGEDEVRSIAVFMETARRPAAFIRAVARAKAAGKPVVVLKVGTSEAAAKAAQAHTGSLVGDDKVFGAVCRRWGIPRVHTMEDLVGVADLIARVGPLKADGLALVGMSGGMCEIAVDQAERDGVPIPELQKETLARLRAALPEFATPSNPLDVTGGAMLKPELLETALGEIARDPGVGIVVHLFDAPAKIENVGIGRVFLKHIGAGFAAGGKPAVMLSHNYMPVSGDARTLAEEAGIIYSGAGLSHGIAAIGHLIAWSRVQRAAPRAYAQASPKVVLRPVGERAVLGHLATSGVPVIPGPITRSADEAVAEAAKHAGAVVLKIASADIPHKTEAGGVALNIRGADAVGAAWVQMMDRVRAAKPGAHIDGIIVSPMRSEGVELFVGTMRDPQWGPVIAVGLGGVFVEALKDTSLRVLPIDESDVLEMFTELRGSALLDGFRGSPAVDRQATAAAVVAIGNAALALGEELVSLEVNPLLVAGSRVEALDGLTIWAD
ncbi:MAG: CoA-binding protein [Hydrocarboniphaga sp.]|uniref:acetate--CoA ligase family protein n=1 Tax=Hydrocarboniphaga sp. TaxID=2033016 RepID=UPI00261AA7E1|nr:acetate--CoA ligase family protein [Hydrocarboniphaga sp.]MDB5969939.1 CoA-binding protein [Hydrocarboniphaga sp.]